MRAKFINEKFTAESDPIKDLNIGYKNYYDYATKKLKQYDVNVDNFITFLYDFYRDTRPNDLIEELLDILEHTPIEFQIEYIDNLLYRFLEDRGLN